ncbi:MAG: hypothetical protein ACR2OJ_03210 [Hyphomicrobiales bacterium]
MLNGIKYSALAIRLLAAVPFVAITALASADETPGEACKSIVGSYVSSVTDIEGVFQSRGLLTFSGDGTFTINDSQQGGIDGVYEPFSSSQGAWTCKTGDDKAIPVQAVGLNFTLPKTSTRSGMGRVDYKASFDPSAKTMAGTIDLRFTGTDDLESANPLEIEGDPFEQFQFTAQKITVPTQ